jgi:hypothetical protein
MIRWGGRGADDVTEAGIPNSAHRSDPTRAASPSVLHPVLRAYLGIGNT